jgi:hypothetical protein
MRHVKDSVLVPLVSLFLLVGGVAECASIKIKVQHTHDATADFSSYTTFEVVPSKSIEDADIKTAVEFLVARELESKGLTEVEEPSDLVVTYDAAVGSKEQIATGIGYGVETINGVTTVYTVSRGVPVGALVISLVDRSNGKVVWQATGKGSLKPGADAETRVKRLEAAVVKILASYPPKR